MEEKTELRLYLIERVNNDCGYEEWESAVVAAYSEEEAKSIYPAGGHWDTEKRKWIVAPEARPYWGGGGDDWVANPSLVKATLLGVAHDTIKAGSAVHGYFHHG